MTSFIYWAHGLHIASEIELPEAAGTEPPAELKTAPDVLIRIGSVPAEVSQFRAMAGEFEVGDREILLRVPGIGRFFMERGEVLTVEPARTASWPMLRFHVLGIALSVILQQRGFLLLHGAACVLGDVAVAFVGHSGTGKSTTTAAFAANGLPILTDDLLTIRFDAEGYPEVCPGIPTIKLWPETAGAILPNAAAPFPQATLFKSRVHLPDVLERKPVRLNNIFELSWLLPDAATPACHVLDPMTSLAALRRHCFHAELISALGCERAFLGQASQLIRHCAVWKLQRPWRLSGASEIATMIRDPNRYVRSSAS